MKRFWTFEDDQFLFEYFEAVGDYIGVHDLGRPKGAATRRVRHLKKTGAWAALERMRAAEYEYAACVSARTLRSEVARIEEEMGQQ